MSDRCHQYHKQAPGCTDKEVVCRGMMDWIEGEMEMVHISDVMCCRSSVPNHRFGLNWQNRTDSLVMVPVLVRARVVGSSSQFGHERNLKNCI
ncbi:uncharacterized protein LACBIDRAFT_308167 [Laccaria bicolor S238N-H82]|uniref:Predicted protein n=1 Tax=Laccaria bicolor (strain S238N-H82 / ATCC MYA-4686) TaxID=486041 RepID=B0DRR3_LACBS|nr:uncharacterized protein LACBIDRAFT_308167 [Laccaria bicolor S238N-H82]EDR02651.1 predicted protein [Laccaria bicolor S238N-H82]|eukprot:XP_001886695.1 predicted protein [Laccaria bicolor S238N-H82]